MTEPMTDLADRLADAPSARATTVLPDPRAYERVVARRRRRRVTRWSTVGAAGLATAGVVAVAAILPGNRPTTAPPVTVPGGAPAHFVAVVDGKAGIFDAAEPDGFSSFNPTGYRTTAVTGQGDDFHFWSASAAADGCRSLMQEVDHSGVTFTAHDLKGGDEVPGEVAALAVTDDGTKLAYTLHTGRDCGTPELHVRDLRTGADRAWRFPASEVVPSLRDSLSWAPDGRHLAYLTCCDVRVLDTAMPGGDLQDPKRALVLSDPRKPAAAGSQCTAEAASYRGKSGELVVYVHCFPDRESPEDTAFVATYDPATRRIGSILFDAPLHVLRLAFDRGGDHLLFEQDADRGENQVVLWRWDGGGAPRVVDTGKDVPFGVDW